MHPLVLFFFLTRCGVLSEMFFLRGRVSGFVTKKLFRTCVFLIGHATHGTMRGKVSDRHSFKSGLVSEGCPKVRAVCLVRHYFEFRGLVNHPETWTLRLLK